MPMNITICNYIRKKKVTTNEQETTERLKCLYLDLLGTKGIPLPYELENKDSTFGIIPKEFLCLIFSVVSAAYCCLLLFVSITTVLTALFFYLFLLCQWLLMYISFKCSCICHFLLSCHCDS